MKLDSGGHGFPVFDKKLKGGYDLPDSGHMLTWECLLNIGKLLAEVMWVPNQVSKNETYSQTSHKW